METHSQIFVLSSKTFESLIFGYGWSFSKYSWYTHGKKISELHVHDCMTRIKLVDSLASVEESEFFLMGRENLLNDTRADEGLGEG